MRIVCFLLLFMSALGSAQNTGINRLSGPWTGKISFNGMELPVVFKFTTDGDSLSATLDSPNQGAFNIPLKRAWMEADSVFIQSPEMNAEYKGLLVNDTSITGNWSQGGMTLPLDLSHKIGAEVKLNRPQEPSEPYPYKNEEVLFKNASAGIELAGTLTIPEGTGPFPAVVLVSGSGPQDRDENVFGHRFFLVIADYLTRNGIAVLRYDDRGVNQSTGDFSGSTTYDFADDAEAAFRFLQTRKDIDAKNIGILGHSEGGLIAPIVASRNKDVSFIILLAGPGLKGREIIPMQSALISRASGISDMKIAEDSIMLVTAFNILEKEKDSEKAKALIRAEAEKTIQNSETMNASEKEEALNHVDDLVNSFNGDWMRVFLYLDPKIALKEVKCPVLALNGEKDLQVPAGANLKVIETTLKDAGNKHFTVKRIPGVNHMFQTCKTGAPSEYSQIEETCSPEVLKMIAGWTKKVVK